MGRPERRERWEAAFSAGPLALTGAALSVCLLLQPSLAARAAFFGFAALAAWASGRRLSPLATILVMAGIVGANLLVPMGKLLARWGPLALYAESLSQGLEKALTFEALVLISKATLSPALRLPGRLGAFFAEALRDYDRILERKAAIRASSFFADVDEVLLSVYHAGSGTEPGLPSPDGPGRKPGDRYLALASLAAAALALATLFAGTP